MRPVHASLKALFQVGDVVDVKGHGRATVIEPLVDDDPTHPQHGRCRVQYHEDGTTFYSNPKKLRKLTLSGARVIVCYRTEHYRAAAVHNVDRQDVCLEVGCHTGTTTRILHNRCAFVVGVDNVGLMVQQARSKSPHVRFELVDGFDIEQVRTLSPTGTFSKIFVDLSGKAPLDLITRFIALYLAAFPDSTLVVKNEALFDYVERMEQLQQQQQQQHAAPAGASNSAQMLSVVIEDANATLADCDVLDKGACQPQQQDGDSGHVPAPGKGRAERRRLAKQQRQAQQAQQAQDALRQLQKEELLGGPHAAGQDLASGLALLCELFRENYVSHSIK